MLLIYDKPGPYMSILKLELIPAEYNTTQSLDSLRPVLDSKAILKVTDVS